MANILIIDDDDQFREMLGQMLECAGYEVILASDGKEGLRLFRKNRVDLVITDIFMLEKDGIEVIMKFRRNFPVKKIIAISGGYRNISPEETLEMVKGFGAKYTFKKPVDRDELLGAIKDLLQEGAV